VGGNGKPLRRRSPARGRAGDHRRRGGRGDRAGRRSKASAKRCRFGGNPCAPVGPCNGQTDWVGVLVSGPTRPGPRALPLHQHAAASRKAAAAQSRAARKEGRGKARPLLPAMAAAAGGKGTTKSRVAFVLVDGVGDVTIPSLSGRTPLEAASAPRLDAVAAAGVVGLMDPVEPGLACGSDTAHLSLLGYDPRVYYRGRGAFESMGAGLAMAPGDIAFKVSLSLSHTHTHTHTVLAALNGS
jgi:hypothetical protein